MSYSVSTAVLSTALRDFINIANFKGNFNSFKKIKFKSEMYRIISGTPNFLVLLYAKMIYFVEEV